MKLRHAAALALVGWYLMVPSKKNLDEPISARLQFSSFDTAKECEDAKSHLADRVASGQLHVAPGQITWSDCIASDEPRLKPK